MNTSGEISKVAKENKSIATASSASPPRPIIDCQAWKRT